MSAGLYAAWVVGTALFIAYMAPTIVALCREMPNTTSVVVINVFAGWTVIGWVGALALACWPKPARPVTYPAMIP